MLRYQDSHRGELVTTFECQKAEQERTLCVVLGPLDANVGGGWNETKI